MNNFKKNYGAWDVVNIFMLITLLAFFGVGILIAPKPDFSESENRALATLEPLSFKSISDGSFFESVSDFYSDRFPLRASFTRLKALCELCLGKGQNNGIIFGKDGYLIPQRKINSAVAEKNVKFLSSLYEGADIPICKVIVPESIDVNPSRLPDGYSSSEGDLWEDLGHMGSAGAKLSHRLREAADSGIEVWYKTDHHWTTRGAYEAYLFLSEKMGYSPYGVEHFTVETVSKDFLGTSHSSAGGLAFSPDSVELYRYPTDSDYSVTVEESGDTFYGFYRSEMLDSKDKYSVFLGGNYARVFICNTTVESRPRLLLVKDSYANSIVPFLALHYDIDMVDPRYFKGNYQSLITEADAVLILVGINTLSSTPLY